MKLQEPYMFTGMQRDMSVSKQPAQFLYNGRNIRITSREGDTLLSITNEKSSRGAINQSLLGAYLGHVLLNKYLVVFSTHGSGTGKRDLIYRIDLSQEPNMQEYITYDVIYNSNDLGFSTKHPIEAIGSYENENVQKVYWTDNYNQPRMINIVANPLPTKARQLDFVPELNLKEKIVVQKLTGSSGTFASGVIQYAFTYYMKYGHESAVFYTTPPMYISPLDRGAAPDEKVDNAFEIRIIDAESSTSFDYLRIYSIQRTSLNGEAIVKRVQDIDLSSVTNNYIYYVDRGVDGDIVDPYSLFYKGGESITAGTLEQKDNTLFLGNISFVRSNLLKEKKNIQSAVSIEQSTRTFVAQGHKLDGYGYGNQLSSLSNVNIDGTSYSQSSPCCGFKCNETYRLGLQFQHKNGQWSMPIFKGDIASSNKPSISTIGAITIPTFTGTLNNSDGIIERLTSAGYRRVRGVVVFPNISDRNIVCQGVANPTLSTENSTYVQSSWFFRPNFLTSEESYSSANTFSPWPKNSLQYADRNITDNIPEPSAGSFNPRILRTVEVQGYYKPNNRFSINRSLCTIHSPEVDFDSQSYSLNYSSLKYRQVGQVFFTHTWSDILIQTETPTISGDGSGFIHKSFSDRNAKGIISGLFYDDYIVNGNRGSEISSNPFRSFLPQKASAKWLIYPWQKDGSLNNDIDRPTEGGVSSSVLKKKIISNLRYATTKWDDNPVSIANSNIFDKKPELFSSDEATIVKLGNTFYCGNIDTVLSPDGSDGVYFAWSGGYTTRSIDGVQQKDYTTPSDTQTPFNSTDWFKTFKYDDNNEYNGKHILYYNTGWYGYNSSDIATKYPDIAIKKGFVRMKYKSSPHLVGAFNSTTPGITEGENYNLPVIEIVRTSVPNRFGGTSNDALQANVWIPCGEPVSLSDDQGNLKNSVTFDYSWGDTYFQRYDCLKTYPFTEDDVNQIVEIGSFMLETHVNIDGRYDKNRGQLSNLYMRPRNFNLINPVYSQLNNFFTYRIMDDKFYENNSFPNQITWTKEKQGGADVDLWTNITLASTYDMDGSKGGVVSLNTWKDNIYCFQKKGVSNILFNSRVQIPTSDGVPIEISNNYKVDGYRYLSDGIGCNSPRLIKETPTGIYFIDSVSNHLFQIGDGINNITQSHNMSSVFRSMVFNKVLYDDVNRDLYLVNNTEALCYSEVLGQFTGFMDYGGASLIESYDKKVFGLHEMRLYELFAGNGYCNLFGVNRPWGLTFVSNGIGNNVVLQDKIFTNLEFRACVEGDGEYDENTGKFTFTLPFDSLEVWDEHQHGKTVLKDVSNMAKPMGHFEDESSSLRRKFRIWRCDIPRNNAPIESDEGLPNLFRKIRKPLDRMRNPWLYVKLQKDAATDGQLEGTELHDIVMTYYS